MTSLQSSVLLLITTVNFSRFLLKNVQATFNFEFSTYDLIRIIRNLNPNKAHGHDMISIQMAICNPRHWDWN